MPGTPPSDRSDTAAPAEPATERLYYADATLLTFAARLTQLGHDGRCAYLDRTAFYPTSGGQPHDLGTLGGVSVVDVVDEGARIAHQLAAPLGAEPGQIVEGAIDPARRWDHMQQHTGQHLLSAVFAELLGHETVSVHFGVEVATLDLAVDQLPSSAIVAVEERANALVAEGRAVTVRFEDAATATGLRKPPARTGTIRVVTIDGVDRSACGGTHVATTGAIGPVLLRRVERVRRATRVEFVCGLRAVRRARADFTALSAVAARLSAGVDAVPALVAVQAEAARRGAADAERLAREVAAARAGALVAGLPPDAAGVRRLVVHAGDPVVDGLGAPADALRLVVQAAGALDGVVAVGVAPANPAAHPASGVAPAAAGAGGALVAGGSDTRGGSGTAVMVAAGVGAGIDAGARLRAALGPLGGRGGGTAGFAQGVVPAERLPPLLAALDVGPAPGGDA